MRDLTWTTDKPTEAGWYWVRVKPHPYMLLLACLTGDAPFLKIKSVCREDGTPVTYTDITHWSQIHKPAPPRCERCNGAEWWPSNADTRVLDKCHCAKKLEPQVEDVEGLSPEHQAIAELGREMGTESARPYTPGKTMPIKFSRRPPTCPMCFGRFGCTCKSVTE